MEESHQSELSEKNTCCGEKEETWKRRFLGLLGSDGGAQEALFEEEVGGAAAL